MSETPRLADLLRQIVESPETPLPDGADEILALSLPDTEAASRLADAPQAARFDNFYPSKAGSRTPSTEGAISKFLENYGTDNPEETSVLERLIFHPVADYSQQLARQEAADAPSAEGIGTRAATSKPSASISPTVIPKRGLRCIFVATTRTSTPSRRLRARAIGRSSPQSALVLVAIAITGIGRMLKFVSKHKFSQINPISTHPMVSYCNSPL